MNKPQQSEDNPKTRAPNHRGQYFEYWHRMVQTAAVWLAAVGLMAQASAVFAAVTTDQSNRLKLQHHLDYDVPLADATWIGTHNSYNSRAYGYPGPLNHDGSLTQQLDAGARAISFDIYPDNAGNARLCHKICSTVLFVDRLALDGFKEVRNWLLANPYEVVIIVIEDGLSSSTHYDYAVAAIINSGIGPLTFRPTVLGSDNNCDDIPLRELTKQDVLDAGKQVILATFEGCDQDGHNWRSWVWNMEGSSPGNDIERYPHQWTVVAEDRAFNSVPELTSASIKDDLKKGAAMIGMDYFININRHEAAIWSWKAGEPNDSGDQDCAVQLADGEWDDQACSSPHRYACQHTGTGAWLVPAASGAWSDGPSVCPGGYVFSVPINANSNAALRSAAGTATVWMNHSDQASEGDWVVGNFVPTIPPVLGPAGSLGASDTDKFRYFRIPDSSPYDVIEFTVKGGDGGKARVTFGTFPSSTAGGGSGANITARFNIGTGPDEIPPGSGVGFVVGHQGYSGEIPANTITGGGGGGSAVLIMPPPPRAFASPRKVVWEPIVVAGGGGGAYNNLFSATSAGGSGAHFVGKGSTGGGSHGASGGGGGFLGTGEEIPCVTTLLWASGEGFPGLRAGGNGGDPTGLCDNGHRNGGYGFGGGGASGAVTFNGGGGGGGYQGGDGGWSGSGGSAGRSYVHTMKASVSSLAGSSTTNPAHGYISWKLLESNTPPVADDDAYNGTEDMVLNVAAAVGVLDGDTDADSDPLTAVKDTNPSNGSVTLNANGSFSYTPNANFCGPDSFTYHANDGTADSNIATVSISVACVNDEPSFTHGGNQSVAEDSGPQSVAAFASASPGGGADEAGQTFSYNVSNSNNALFSAQPAISPAGTLSYTSALNAFGTATVTVSVTDSGGTDNGGDNTSPAQSFDIEVTPVNDAPVATDDSYTENEDTQLTGNVIIDDTGDGVDSDVDGDGLSISSSTDVSHGTLVLNGNGAFTYDPNLNYCGPDSFTYVITDDPPLNGDPLTSNTATVSITVTCVNDPPEVAGVAPLSQTADYSDDIGTVTITVVDVDDTSTTLEESGEPPASDFGLALTLAGCVEVETESPDENGSTCTWTYDGQVLDPGDNFWTIVFTPSDEAAGTVTGTHELTVEPEDATVTLAGANPVAVEVAEPEGDSGEFLLYFSAWETTDPEDFPHDGSAAPGDLNEMVPYMELVPVGPGGPEPGVCDFFAPLPNPLDGYGQVAVFECVFDQVPVNTYEVNAWVDGSSMTTRYYFGGDDGVLVVYDPSLGFTTGGGWFYWPGTADPDLLSCGDDGYPGDRTNFGYTMKYNKKRTNVQGSLLLQRHTVDAACEGAGKYRVKSNQLDGLSIGDGTDADGDYGWAAFSGKSVFREPGDEEGEGNHPFLVYVEDHADEGGNQAPADEFWIRVEDKDGVVVLEVRPDPDPDPDAPSDPAGPNTATDGDDTPIHNGNIIVPH
jgi:VCBS repeat-containing protein